jgi:hypothetical protein
MGRQIFLTIVSNKGSIDRARLGLILIIKLTAFKYRSSECCLRQRRSRLLILNPVYRIDDPGSTAVPESQSVCSTCFPLISDFGLAAVISSIVSHRHLQRVQHLSRLCIALHFRVLGQATNSISMFAQNERHSRRFVLCMTGYKRHFVTYQQVLSSCR